MKVKQLVNVLQEVDPEAEVFFTYDNRCRCVPVTVVDAATIPNKWMEVGIHLRSETTEEYLSYSFQDSWRHFSLLHKDEDK